jgi:hypothetical protein
VAALAMISIEGRSATISIESTSRLHSSQVTRPGRRRRPEGERDCCRSPRMPRSERQASGSRHRIVGAGHVAHAIRRRDGDGIRRFYQVNQAHRTSHPCDESTCETDPVHYPRGLPEHAGQREDIWQRVAGPPEMQAGPCPPLSLRR